VGADAGVPERAGERGHVDIARGLEEEEGPAVEDEAHGPGPLQCADPRVLCQGTAAAGGVRGKELVGA
jgi:hypothetical protein